MSARFQHKRDRDLFDQSQASDRKIRRKTRILLPRIKKSMAISYENLIFLAIAFVMCCIIFFSAGVEKGRRDVNHVSGIEQPAHRDTEVAVQEKDKGRSRDRYIIHMAAFKKNLSAEKEVARLRAEGYEAGIKKTGGYAQVYIGGFENKKKAGRLLRKLKKRYKDSYITKY